MDRRRPRWSLWLASALAHALLLAWLNLQVPRTSGLGEGQGVAVGLFDASALEGEARSAELVDAVTELVQPPPEPVVTATEAAAAQPLDRVLPTLVEPLYTAPPSAVRFDGDPVEVGAPLQATLAAASAGGGGDACRLGDRLQGVLQANTAVRAAIARIPAEKRSVSNAVNVWNGRWLALGDGGGVIQAAVNDYVAAAPERCREEAVSGPSLLPIAGEPKPTILVLGSGLWRWSDLLTDAAPERGGRKARGAGRP